MALPLVLPVINKLIYAALIVTESAGQPSVRLFSGLVLFFVITVQVAAVKSRSTKWPHPVLQLESERESSDDGEAHFAFTNDNITREVPSMPSINAAAPVKNIRKPATPISLHLQYICAPFWSRRWVHKVKDVTPETEVHIHGSICGWSSGNIRVRERLWFELNVNSHIVSLWTFSVLNQITMFL